VECGAYEQGRTKQVLVNTGGARFSASPPTEAIEAFEIIEITAPL
jgi:hypothetical protein